MLKEKDRRYYYRVEGPHLRFGSSCVCDPLRWAVPNLDLCATTRSCTGGVVEGCPFPSASQHFSQ